MTDTSIVYITSLRLTPPGEVVFHAPNLKWNRTECGLAIDPEKGFPGQVLGVSEMVACRRDTAELIGRPCGRCLWWGKE